MKTPGARLMARIDLDRIAANFSALDALSGNAPCAGVVKADAYGHGMRAVALTLAEAGCRHFFTATFDEALALREILPDKNAITIAVFDGLLAHAHNEAREAILRGDILPAVNSADDLAILAGWARQHNAASPIPAILQLDTGMNRLGVSAVELPGLIASPDFACGAWRLILSHLACADEPASPMNPAQKTAFDSMRAALPPPFDSAPASLAASGGILLGAEYHYSMTRAGIGLYGAAQTPAMAEHVRPALTLSARVLQIREARAGESVGYGGEGKIGKSPARLATIAGGYGDGIPRALGNGRGVAHKDGRTAPFIGRVSMDTSVIDISGWPPDHLATGDMVDLLHPGHSAADMAAIAGTIDYDILTGLGLRAERVYTGG